MNCTYCLSVHQPLNAVELDEAKSMHAQLGNVGNVMEGRLIATIESLTKERDTLYKAVKYALDRQQTDADFGYYCGPGSEVFRLLCLAEAAYHGRPFEEVEAGRKQAHWNGRRPSVVLLREELEKLELGR